MKIFYLLVFLFIVQVSPTQIPLREWTLFIKHPDGVNLYYLYSHGGLKDEFQNEIQWKLENLTAKEYEWKVIGYYISVSGNKHEFSHDHYETYRLKPFQTLKRSNIAEMSDYPFALNDAIAEIHAQLILKEYSKK